MIYLYYGKVFICEYLFNHQSGCFYKRRDRYFILFARLLKDDSFACQATCFLFQVL